MYLLIKKKKSPGFFCRSTQSPSELWAWKVDSGGTGFPRPDSAYKVVRNGLRVVLMGARALTLCCTAGVTLGPHHSHATSPTSSLEEIAEVDT